MQSMSAKELHQGLGQTSEALIAWEAPPLAVWGSRLGLAGFVCEVRGN